MIKNFLFFVLVAIHSCHAYMMEMSHAHPQTKYCEAEFVAKIEVMSKREVRLFRDGTFRVITEHEYEENNFSSDYDDSENNPSESGVEIYPSGEGSSDQPEVFPGGPDTNQGGREVVWPGIEPSNLKSKQPTRRIEYFVRGPQGSRPGERPKMDHFRLNDFPVPVPNRPQGARRRHVLRKMKSRRTRALGTGDGVESDQPEEVPAGPDASDGGRELTWGRIQAGRPKPRNQNQGLPYSSRGSEGSRPGESRDFESLNSASLRLPGGPTPIPISENQNVRREYSHRGSDGSRPGHSGDFESLNSGSLRLPDGPVPIPIESENSQNRERRFRTRKHLNLKKKLRDYFNSGSQNGRDLGGFETQYLINILKVYKGNVSNSTMYLYSPLTSNLGHADLSLGSQYVIMGCFFRENLLYVQQSDFKINLNRLNETELINFEISLTRRYSRNCARCPIKVCSYFGCPQRSNDYCVWKHPSTLTDPKTVHFICVEKRNMPRHCAWRNFIYPGTILSTRDP